MHHQAWDMAWDQGVEVTRTRDPAADTALGGGIVIARPPPPLAGEARARGRRPERVNRYTEIHGDGHAALITLLIPLSTVGEQTRPMTAAEKESR